MKKRKKENCVPDGPRRCYDAEKERAKNIVGKRIAAARRAAGLSLVALSELLKELGVSVTSSSVSKWELGYTLPNAYQLLAIAHALKIQDPFRFFCEESGEVLPEEPLLNAAGRKKLEEYKQDLLATGKYSP